MLEKMPAIFIGHGSPMNAIESNTYTESWTALGQKFSPKAILMVSGHWFVNGLFVQDEIHPKKIDDMYGFPQALYDLKYPVRGDKTLSEEVQTILGGSVLINNDWGIDHGAWSILTHMYPEANIPVVQLSVDRRKGPKDQYEVGVQLSKLRDKGYMILGSGNVVHNLGQVAFDMSEGYDWAIEFDNYIEEAIITGNHQSAINYLDYGQPAKLSVPSPDHYYPLLTILGTLADDEKVTVFNKATQYGGLSMTSYLFDSREIL